MYTHFMGEFLSLLPGRGRILTLESYSVNPVGGGRKGLRYCVIFGAVWR